MEGLSKLIRVWPGHVTLWPVLFPLEVSAFSPGLSLQATLTFLFRLFFFKMWISAFGDAACS